MEVLVPDMYRPRHGDAVYVPERLNIGRQPNGYVSSIEWSSHSATVYFLTPVEPGQLEGGDTEDYDFDNFDFFNPLGGSGYWQISFGLGGLGHTDAHERLTNNFPSSIIEIVEQGKRTATRFWKRRG